MKGRKGRRGKRGIGRREWQKGKGRNIIPFLQLETEVNLINYIVLHLITEATITKKFKSLG